MIRHIITTLLIYTASAAIALAQTKNNYVLEVGDFSELTVAHGVNVEYFCRADSAGFVKFDASPAYASAISFSNRSGKLKIEIVANAPLVGEVPSLTIYSSKLTKATNLADSTVMLRTTAPTETISLKVIGNGSLTASMVHATKISAAVEAGSGNVFIAGRSAEASFTLASTGTIEAGRLQTDKVKCLMFGTGAIDCSPIKQLTVMGVTSGTVYYTGNPEIKKRNIGAKLVKMN